MKPLYSILLLLFITIIYSCKTGQHNNKEVVINELIILGVRDPDLSDRITINYFKSHYALNPKNQIVKKDFSWDSIGQSMVDNGKRTPIALATIINHDIQDKDISEKVTIENGYPTEYLKSFYVIYQNDKWIEKKVMQITYKKGVISGKFIIKSKNDSILYETKFKNGTGYWKDFYYTTGKIKEEGNVTSNCKIGTWTYYDPTGKIDSTKTYSLNQKVEVRFPHCLFNKSELGH